MKTTIGLVLLCTIAAAVAHPTIRQIRKKPPTAEFMKELERVNKFGKLLNEDVAEFKADPMVKSDLIYTYANNRCFGTTKLIRLVRDQLYPKHKDALEDLFQRHMIQSHNVEGLIELRDGKKIEEMPRPPTLQHVIDGLSVKDAQTAERIPECPTESDIAFEDEEVTFLSFMIVILNTSH